MKHAMVQRDGFTVPLIGIPMEATLQECDFCHDYFAFTQILFTGKQFLCKRCSAEDLQRRHYPYEY